MPGVVIEYQIPMRGHQFTTLAAMFILVRDLPVICHAVTATVAVTRSRTVTITVTAMRRLAILTRETHQLVNGLFNAAMTAVSMTTPAASMTTPSRAMQHLVDGVCVMVRLHLDGHMDDQATARDATCLQQRCGQQEQQSEDVARSQALGGKVLQREGERKRKGECQRRAE